MNDLSPFRGRRNDPHFDSPTSIEILVTAEDVVAAEQSQPDRCALAMAVREHTDYHALVYNQIALLLKPATRELLQHAKRRGNPHYRHVKVGQLVLWRYRLSTDARDARATYDGPGVFPPGHYILRAPSHGDRVTRDKRNESRRKRADAYRDGTTPQYTRVTDEVRHARANAILRGEA